MANTYSEGFLLTKLRILFIAGASRSGSTLLDRIFGSMPQYASLGEVHNIWKRGFQENQSCGCGRTFSDCESWSAVRSHLTFSNDKGVEGLLQDQVKVVRNRNIPFMTRPGAGWLESRTRYMQALRELYESVAAESSSEIIVDSSKRAAHGFLLASDPSLDVSTIHLVRDSRAMAFSAMRKKAKLDAGREGMLMAQLSARQSASGWNRQNLACELFATRHKQTARLRYEDLVNHPAAELVRATDALDLPLDLGWLQGKTADLNTAHTVSGNPMRLKAGPVVLRLDDEWQDSMNRRDRRLVTAITSPLLIKYGYSLKRPS